MKEHKEILNLAVPNIISNISVPLLSSVDIALMGSLSSLHLGAVGGGAIIFNFIYWNFGFLRMGTTGLTAQAVGAEDKGAIIHTLARTLLLAFGFGLLIVLLQNPIEYIGLKLMNIPENQYDLVRQYFYIRILAAPITLALISMMGWFFGMQNAIFPLFLTIIINIANILMSYILVAEYDMGVAGVAYGTVFAQSIGLCTAFLLWAWKYKGYRPYFSAKICFAKQGFLSFLEINTDIFLRTFCLTLALGFFFSQSAAISAELLAINTILFQLVNWVSFAIDGFAYAAESLVGKYSGAKKDKKTSQIIQLSMRWGLLLAFIFSLIYFVFGADLLAVFTKDTELIAAAKPYLWWVVLLPIFAAPCYIWDGIFIGLTASKSMRNTMFIAIVVYFLTYYLGAFYYANKGMQANFLWFALLLFLATRGGLQWLLYKNKGLNLN